MFMYVTVYLASESGRKSEVEMHIYISVLYIYEYHEQNRIKHNPELKPLVLPYELVHDLP